MKSYRKRRSIKLIKTIRKYECLYNKNCKEYKLKDHKQNVWSEIAKKVGMSVIEVKKKWKTFKDHYHRKPRQTIIDGVTHRQYVYAEHLRFLDKFMSNKINGNVIILQDEDDEVSTDLSTDNEHLYTPPRKQTKNDFDELPDDELQKIFNDSWNNDDDTDDSNGLVETLTMDGSTKQTQDNEAVINDSGNDVNADDGKRKSQTNVSTKQNLNSEGIILQQQIKMNKENSEEYREVVHSKNQTYQFVTLNEKIIDEVKKHECIYNSESKQFKNYQYKLHIWQKIGKRVGITGKEASLKWKNFRDSYRKYKLKALKESGSIKPYKYAERLKFLDDLNSYKKLASKRTNKSQSDQEVSTDLSGSDDDGYNDTLPVAASTKPLKNKKTNKCLPTQELEKITFIDVKQNSDNELIKEESWNNDDYVENNNGKCTSLSTNQNWSDEETKETYSIVQQLINENKEKTKKVNEKLIDEVKKHELIYNFKCELYKNYEYKLEIWDKIGKRLGLTGKKARLKWNSIRGSYRRYKIKILTKKGTIIPYKHAERLKFLDDFNNYKPLRTRRNKKSFFSDQEVSTDFSGSDDDRDNDILQVPISTEQELEEENPVLDSENVNRNWDNEALKEDSWNNDDDEDVDYVNYKKETCVDFQNWDNKGINEECSELQQRINENNDEITTLNEKLIDEVKKHELIYNFECELYKNYEYKLQIWHKIGKRVGLTAKEARFKWKNIRDAYRKYKLKILNENGIIKPYIYAERLKFLDDLNSYKPSTNSLCDQEVSTDFSGCENDSDILQIPTTTKDLRNKKLNNTLPTQELEENSEDIDENNITIGLFNLLVDKIDKANLNADERHDIEFAVSSAVYSKLAEYTKNSNSV